MMVNILCNIHMNTQQTMEVLFSVESIRRDQNELIFVGTLPDVINHRVQVRTTITGAAADICRVKAKGFLIEAMEKGYINLTYYKSIIYDEI